MRRLLYLLFFVALLGYGCSGGKQSSGDTSGGGDKPKIEKLKVALLTPGSVSDSGWNALAYEGLQAVKEELGAEVSNQQAASTAEIRDALRTYAGDGYNLIFGHGYEYNAPSIEIGKDFPNTVFVSSSGGETAKNVGTFRFYLEQGFYLAGMMAAEMSKTGKIAMITGQKIPSIESTFDAFEAGAKSVKPDIEVMRNYSGTFTDVAKAHQATLAAISAGADMVIHQANESAQGVFNACKEKGVYAFGANADQNENPSGMVIASAVIIAKPAFVSLAKDVQAGKYVGGVTLKGMDTDSVDFVINPALQNKVPEPLIRKIEETKAKIKAGQLKVPKKEF
jgi:basic membrane protein A and related proteins